MPELYKNNGMSQTGYRRETEHPCGKCGNNISIERHETHGICRRCEENEKLDVMKSYYLGRTDSEDEE